MDETQRWAAGVQYLGSAHAGWQRQTHARGVQQTLEDVLSSIAGHPVQTQCAGRTDAGVHAVQQVVHFDSTARRSARSWLLGGNSRLPLDVSLRWVVPVDAGFHARHSALARRYCYLILNDTARSALLDGRANWIHAPLDAERMHRAAQCLLGEHDFSAFRGAMCQSSTPWRCVTDIAVQRRGQRLLIEVRANAFLHHMVRNIVGSLIEVGKGRRPECWLAELLAGRDRRAAGMTAAAEGLYFVTPDYPPEFRIPQPADIGIGG